MISNMSSDVVISSIRWIESDLTLIVATLLGVPFSISRAVCSIAVKYVNDAGSKIHLSSTDLASP
jgi:hypothetical protein